jgi:hypothetical protein
MFYLYFLIYLTTTFARHDFPGLARALRPSDLTGILDLNLDSSGDSSNIFNNNDNTSNNNNRSSLIIAATKLSRDLLLKTKFDLANDAMDRASRASANSKKAVQAAASALATCTVQGDVDCEKLKELYGQSTVYIEVASSQTNSAKAEANISMAHAKKAKKNKKNNENFSLVNSQLADMASSMAQDAVDQAEIAAMVAATASAQCKVMVNIKCNVCPTANLIAQQDGLR